MSSVIFVQYIGITFSFAFVILHLCQTEWIGMVKPHFIASTIVLYTVYSSYQNKVKRKIRDIITPGLSYLDQIYGFV